MHLACDGFDFLFKPQEVAEVKSLWNKGLHYKAIATYVGRAIDEKYQYEPAGEFEVLFLIADLLHNEEIQPREGGFEGTKTRARSLCRTCGEREIKYKNLKLCGRCYQRSWRHTYRDPNAKQKYCQKCYDKVGRLNRTGLCKNCYDKQHSRKRRGLAHCLNA